MGSGFAVFSSSYNDSFAFICCPFQHEGTELAFSSSNTDPPLSPISLISQEERDNIYPNVHMEIPQAGSEQATATIPLLLSDPETKLAENQLDHASYKPQIIVSRLHEEELMENEEEQRDMTTCQEGNRCSGVFGGLLGSLHAGFLSSMEVGLSVSPFKLTLNSVSCPLHPEIAETTSVSTEDLLLGRKLTEAGVRPNSPSLDSQQSEIRTCDTADASLTQCTFDTRLIDGYFPQVAAVSCSTLCDKQK